MPKQVALSLYNRERLFQIFKYTVYFMLFINIFYWAREDYLAASHTFRGGIGWQHIGDAFAQAVDTIAWFSLLILFELETYAISDEKLTAQLKWVLNTLAGLCYLLIVIAFFGYINKVAMVYNFTALPITDACGAIGDYLSYAVGLDDYTALTPETCSSLAGPFYGNSDASLLATATIHETLQWLAAAEAFNAAVWVLIVLFLWIDLFLQLNGEDRGPLYKINITCKAILYASLIAVCIYFAFEADFMEFWDAFLWIIAFFFIEMNMFQWAEETHETLKLENIDEKA